MHGDLFRDEQGLIPNSEVHDPNDEVMNTGRACHASPYHNMMVL